MEQKKHKPIVYKYYQYLKKNHLGAENGIKRQDLARFFGVTLTTQKEILREINESSDFDKLISTSNSIYMCKRKREIQLTLNNTWNTAKTLIKKARAMTDKAERNGQYKIPLGDYYKDFVTVFVDGGAK